MDTFETFEYLKPLKGFEDYSISKDGDLYLNMNKLDIDHYDEDLIAARIPLSFPLEDDKEETWEHFIHILVAEHFVPNPHNKTFVLHINGDIYDNRAENLQWVDREEFIEKDEKEAWKEGFRLVSSGMLMSSNKKSS